MDNAFFQTLDTTGTSDFRKASVMLAPHALYKRLNDEGIVLDLQGQKYFRLNAVGSRFWEILVDQQRVENVISVLLNEYDVDEMRLLADLRTIIGDLVAAGLVQVTFPSK